MSHRSSLGSSTIAQFPTKGTGERSVPNGFFLMEKMLSLLLDKLPSSTGTVSGPDTEGIYDVTVSWAERDKDEETTRSVSFEIKPLD
jgi:hypothetical protein